MQKFSEKRKRSIDSRGNVVMSMEIGGDLEERLVFWAMVLMKKQGFTILGMSGLGCISCATEIA